MCDFSLHLVISRPAKLGDRLATTVFLDSTTRGFATLEERDVAVCLLPGTELSFDAAVECGRTFFFGKRRLPYATARFRQVNMSDPLVHHDALEFPDGTIVLVTQLTPGQRATVLQLPAMKRAHDTKSHQDDDGLDAAAMASARS